jgi:hypothetical protein
MVNGPIRREKDPTWSPVDEASIGSKRPIGLSSGIQGLPGTTNVDPVYLGYGGTSAPYGSPRPIYSNVYEQRQQLSSLRSQSRKDPAAKTQYEAIVNLLRARGYLGPRSKATPSNVDGAWMELLKENSAAADSVFASTPTEMLVSGVPSEDAAGMGTGGRGGGRAAAYTGPVESITKLADSDIRATADAVAIEILGRGATDEEIKKITQRMRKAEMEQPQVTTRQGPGRQITEQGLSAQGRDDILRDVLSKNPDFQQYQLDTTVMDAMVRFVNKKKAIAGD